MSLIGCAPSVASILFRSISSVRWLSFKEPCGRPCIASKYQRLASLADLFGGWLGDYWIENELHADRIMPVPLHPARERERGYNQSGLLARRLSKRVGVPVAESGLQRIPATAVQMELDAAQRRLNVAGAFACVGPAVRQKRVAVIDDVCTTGATLDACAAALLQAGAASVFGLTLARTP